MITGLFATTSGECCLIHDPFLGPCMQTMSGDAAVMLFHKHFGSSPLDLADMWYDLTVTDIPGATLNEKEKTRKGFVHYMKAHFYLWTYPKNTALLATRMGMNEKYTQGAMLWGWIAKIAALRA